MSELTREYFEQHLKEQLGAQTSELKAYAREQTEELARMVSSGFDDIRDRLDVRERVVRVENGLQRIAKELHISL
jgi:hypothetical protein